MGPNAGHLNLVELMGYVPHRQLALLFTCYTLTVAGAFGVGYWSAGDSVLGLSPIERRASADEPGPPRRPERFALGRDSRLVDRARVIYDSRTERRPTRTLGRPPLEPAPRVHETTTPRARADNPDGKAVGRSAPAAATNHRLADEERTRENAVQIPLRNEQPSPVRVSATGRLAATPEPPSHPAASLSFSQGAPLGPTAAGAPREINSPMQASEAVPTKPTGAERRSPSLP